MDKVQYTVEYLIFYKHVSISVVGSLFTGYPTQFDLLDIDISLGMNWLHTHRAKIDCKDCKVSLRDEKRHIYVFMDKV